MLQVLGGYGSRLIARVVGGFLLYISVCSCRIGAYHLCVGGVSRMPFPYRYKGVAVQGVENSSCVRLPIVGPRSYCFFVALGLGIPRDGVHYSTTRCIFSPTWHGFYLVRPKVAVVPYKPRSSVFRFGLAFGTYLYFLYRCLGDFFYLCGAKLFFPSLCVGVVYLPKFRASHFDFRVCIYFLSV